MDDVVRLLSFTFTEDAYGNQIETPAQRQVFCQVRSVSRSEFYQAAQTDLHPEYVFILSNYRDYLGEQELLYTDWTGRTRRMNILRTYRTDRDELEIVAGEQIGSAVYDELSE